MNDSLTSTAPSALPLTGSWQARIKSLERLTLKSPFIASLLWMAALFAIAIAVHTPAFETNDDVVMSMIASGTGASTQPDEHLVFTSFAIGLLLKNLYTLFPVVPWYGLYLVSIHYLSHVAVLYALLKWRYSRAAVFCYYILFATVGVQLMSRLQFTSTAVWSTECGILLAFTGLAMRRDGESRIGFRMIVSGLALTVLGSLVRFDSYIAAFSISMIPMVLLLWWQDRSVAPAKRVWPIAMLAVVLSSITAFGMHAAHQRYYNSDPAWREFLVFNPYRVKFNDYCWTRYTDETKPVFDGVHWSENDHDMIRNQYFDDPQVFGRQTLQAIVEGYPWAQNTFSLRKMADWWNEILRNVRLWPIWALIPLQIWWARDRRFAISHFLILTVSLDAVICGLMFLKNPPGRVYYPLVAFQGLYSLYLMRCCTASAEKNTELSSVSEPPPIDVRSSQWQQMQYQSFVSGALCAIAVIGLCAGQYKAHRDSRKAVKANRLLHENLAMVDPRESDLFVCWGCDFPYESILPLESNDVLRRLNILTLGWTQQSPVNDAVKEHFGIRDLTLSLMDNPNVYLLVQDSELDYYRTYIHEHFGIDVEWDLCFEGSAFNLVKPVKADLPDKLSRPSATAASLRWHDSRR